MKKTPYNTGPSPQGRGFCRYLLLPVAFLLSCTRPPLAVIEGRLPDTRYDGETVYMVPLRNATARNVDSTRIRQGTFRFKRTPGKDTDNLWIIRTRPLLRLRLQELIVISEPGLLHVTLDSVSSAHGTASNNALQQWKDARRQAGADYTQYTLRFIRQNKQNAAGRFVYEMSRSLFTPEQRQSLQMPD